MKRALLVIDVQNEYFSGKMPVTYPPGSLSNIVKAMEGAERAGIPIVVIQHSSLRSNSGSFVKGSNGWELHEAIANLKYDLLIEKNLPGSFTGTGLEGFLRGNDIDTVVISGYMTQMCCDTTSRQAYHLGFAVEFLTDGTGTLNISNDGGAVSAEELHRAILVTQGMLFAKVTATDDWLNAIGESAGK